MACQRLEFCVNMVPLSSPSVSRRTLVKPPGNAQWWQSQLCGHWTCLSPTPLPQDTVGDPVPLQGAGQTSSRTRGRASAVGVDEGGGGPLSGLWYQGSLISVLCYSRLWPVTGPSLTLQAALSCCVAPSLRDSQSCSHDWASCLGPGTRLV